MRASAARTRRSIFGGKKEERSSLLADAVVGRSPSDASSHSTPIQVRQACRAGTRCKNITDATHRNQCAHVGDPDYRNGLVEFADGDAPELSSLRSVFHFFNASASDRLDEDEFTEAVVYLRNLMTASTG